MEGMRVTYDRLAPFLNSYNAVQAVPQIEVPTYFFQGKRDLNTPSVFAKEYFDQLIAKSGKWWIELEDAAHFPMYEQPLMFLEVLKKATLSEREGK